MSKLIALFLLVLTMPIFAGKDFTKNLSPLERLDYRISNTDNQAAFATITAYNASGHVIASQVAEVDAGQDLFLADVLDLPDTTAYITTEHNAVSSAKTRREAAMASSWRLENAMDSQTALVIRSLGAHEDAVYLHAFNNDGENVRAWALTDSMAAKSNQLVFIKDLEDIDAFIDDHDFRVTSTAKFAVGAYGLADESGRVFNKTGNASSLSKSESSRDDFGVWFIRGGSLYDAIEMMGYNIAVDRLWQLELHKRTGTGRLAEIFGQNLVNQDVQVRMSGYSVAELDAYLEAADQDTRDMIKGYTDGVNRRIAEVNGNPALLPFEMLALGMFQVESWGTHDVMAWTALLQRNFSSLGNLGFSQVDNALVFLNLVENNKPFEAAAKFTDMIWVNDRAAQTMIPADLSKGMDVQAEKDEAAFQNLVEAASRLKNNKTSQLDDFREFVNGYNEDYENNVSLLKDIGAFVKGGSYAWVVSGDLTESGNPILYSGPQMGFGAPAICVEGSIQTESLNISGMTIPGVPTMIIGRTPHHVWSMQVGHTNTWDWYVNNPAEVSMSHTETVHVAGGESISVPIFRSPHGPVMAQEPFILSWKYSSWGKEWDIANGSLSMARAQSMEEFGEAINHMAVTQHYCYADVDGNIAYWMGGRRPVREAGEYRLPQGLLGSRLEWDASNFHPPYHDNNTTQGYYGGWNNKASVDADDTGGNYLYGQFHRAHVVTEGLASMDNMSFEQIRDLAIDISATDSFNAGGNIWSKVSEIFSNIVAQDPTEERLAALDILNGWDGHFVDGGPDNWVFGMDEADGWSLSDAWIRNVLDLAFTDDFGTSVSWTRRYNMFLREVHQDAGRRNNYRKWLRNMQDPNAPQTMNDIVIEGLDRALAQLGERPWGTGDRGYIQYGHAFLPNEMFPPTPFGSRSTYAHIVEMGATGPIRIESMFPLGESGFIGIDAEGNPVYDPHFFSMKPVFDSFTPRTFPLFDE